MDRVRWWAWVVDATAVVWLCLFAIDAAASLQLITLAGGTAATVRWVLRTLFLVFVLDLILLYRWSDKGPRAFVRSNWFLILTVVPWFRPLRLLRAGRGLRVIRLLVGSRRLGALYNKAHRMGERLWSRIRG